MVSAITDRRFGLAGNTAYKAPVTVVATANVVQSGEQTIDTVALLSVNASGVPDRVLCTAQTDPTKNGVWNVSTAAWTRSIDANGNLDLAQGTQVSITSGTHAQQIYILTTPGPITIGTTALSFSLSLSAGFLATLAASGGAGLIGNTPGTAYADGTVGYTLNREIWANLKTTNTAAQNDAAFTAGAALCQSLGGGMLRLPCGNFQHSHIVFDTALYPKVSICGSGKSATILTKADATLTPVLDISAAALTQTFLTFSDFSIVGNASLSPGLRTTLIAVFSLRSVGISACSIGWDNVASLVASVYDTDFRSNVTGYRATKSGFIYPNLITFFGGQCISNSAIGFDVVHGNGVTWDHVDVEQNGVFGNAATGGVFLRSTTNLEIGFGTFSFKNNCWFEQNHGPSLTVENAAGIEISISDTKFIRANVGTDSAVAMLIGVIESCDLLNVFAVSSLAGNLTSTIAASRSHVQSCLLGILTDNSTTYLHEEVGTSSELIQLRAGGGGTKTQMNSTSVATDGSVTAGNSSAGAVGGVTLSKRYALNGASGTISLPIPVSVGVGNAFKVMVGGADAGGVAFAREYLVATQVNGGAGALVASAQVATVGSTTPGFTFGNSAGFATVSVSSGNMAQVWVVGG